MIQGNVTFTSVASGSSPAQGIAAAVDLRILGYSIRETAGSAATLNIEHGTANSSPIMAAINLAANGSDGQNYFPQGLPCEGGVWIERLTGTSEITLTTAIL